MGLDPTKYWPYSCISWPGGLESITMTYEHFAYDNQILEGFSKNIDLFHFRIYLTRLTLVLALVSASLFSGLTN